jgi:hypothetical protein
MPPFQMSSYQIFVASAENRYDVTLDVTADTTIGEVKRMVMGKVKPRLLSHSWIHAGLFSQKGDLFIWRTFDLWLDSHLINDDDLTLAECNVGKEQTLTRRHNYRGRGSAFSRLPSSRSLVVWRVARCF